MKKFILAGFVLTSLVPISAYSKDLCLIATTANDSPIYVKFISVKSLQKRGAIVALRGVMLQSTGHLVVPLTATAVVLADGSVNYQMFGEDTSGFVSGASEKLDGGLWDRYGHNSPYDNYVLASMDCKTFPAY